MSFTITEQEKQALKDNFAIYLGKKPEEDDLKARLKQLKDERGAAHERVLQTMTTKKIPMIKSADYGYQISCINKKRKTAPKVADYLDTIEALHGAEFRTRIDRETKKRCTEVKEAQTLKLVKLDGVGVLHMQADQATAAAAAAASALPRYDEDASDESE